MEVVLSADITTNTLLAIIYESLNHSINMELNIIEEVEILEDGWAKRVMNKLVWGNNTHFYDK